jgi:hypothetical protein
MTPRRRKSTAELLAEIEAERQRDADRAQFLAERPELLRIQAAADGIEDPYEVLKRQMTVVMDHAVARAIRAERAGTGIGLRAMGFIEIAEALGY